MADVSQKSLSDVGTRYDHIADLLDYWGAGIEVVTNTLTRFSNTKDLDRKMALEIAMRMLSIYRDSLAGYDSKLWRLREEVEKIPQNKWESGNK